MVAISDQQVIEALLERAAPRLKRRILALIAWLRGRTTLPEVTKLIRLGRGLSSYDPDEIQRVGVGIANEVEGLFRRAATTLAKELAEGLDVPLAYDATNPRAVRILDSMELRLAEDFTANTRDAMRAVLRDGLERGLNPRVTATRLRASIGLSAHEVEQAQNYERLLRAGSKDALDRELRDARFDRSVARAASGGTPLTETQIQRMVSGYYDGLTATAAETLARTESLAAVHMGAEEMWSQAIGVGDVDPAAMECIWQAGDPPRTRAWHASMDGQTRAFGETFLSGKGNALRFPCDPAAPISERARCRCNKITRYRIPAKTAEAA